MLKNMAYRIVELYFTPEKFIMDSTGTFETNLTNKDVRLPLFTWKKMLHTTKKNPNNFDFCKTSRKYNNNLS